MKNKKLSIRIAVIILLGIVTLLISPFLGIINISASTIFSNEQLFHIFFQIRLPRTLVAFICGGGLAITGMVFQALFRNPLASPYTLGISSGASLGAAISILLGLGGTVLGFPLVSFGAFAGAVGAVLIVYSFAWSHESNSTTLLLAGVVVATVCSGFIMFIHYISPLAHSFEITRWLMGGVDGSSYSYLFTATLFVLPYLIVLLYLAPQLDHFLTGDSLAHSRGVNIKKSRNRFILASAIIIGAIVSVCGPIGFVGIMSPHACRIILPSARHRLLAIGSFVLGGTFLILSDTLARTIAPPSEIPVGILTALSGGPFFLSILYKKKNRIRL